LIVTARYYRRAGEPDRMLKRFLLVLTGPVAVLSILFFKWKNWV
jgi:hypothetical protein